MTLSEYGIKNNLNDEDLIIYAKKAFGMDEEDTRLMLALERGEIESDVIDEVQ